MLKKLINEKQSSTIGRSTPNRPIDFRILLYVNNSLSSVSGLFVLAGILYKSKHVRNMRDSFVSSSHRVLNKKKLPGYDFDMG